MNLVRNGDSTPTPKGWPRSRGAGSAGAGGHDRACAGRIVSGARAGYEPGLAVREEQRPKMPAVLVLELKLLGPGLSSVVRMEDEIGFLLMLVRSDPTRLFVREERAVGVASAFEPAEYLPCLPAVLSLHHQCVASLLRLDIA